MRGIAVAGKITGKQLRTSIRAGAFALVVFSAVALMFTQRLFLSSFLLMAAAVVAWFVATKKSYDRFWEVASLLYLVFFLFDIFRFSSTLAPALVHLFVFILINKLFNLRTTRDYYQLYLLTFLCMLAASSLNIEIEMFYLILAYIVLFLWNLVAMTLLREWQRQESETLFPFSLFHPVLWIAVLVSSGLAFAFALGIFFILPRIQLGFFGSMRSQKLQHVSGFSQNVSLGDISSIGSNTGLAMRVKVTGGEAMHGRHFYWRGMAFDHYDGKSWSTTRLQEARFLGEDSFGNFYNGNYAGDPQLLVKQEFYLEPIDTRVIFGQDRIVRIRGPFSGITRDANQTLTGLTRLTHYEVYSKVNEFSPTQVAGEETLPANIRNYYFQIPTLSSEFHSLSASLAGKSSGAVERILTVKEYLAANYIYSTENLPQDQTDPISEFLFRNKTGACEYFATSMALLLRDMGVPSRLATGYLEGEYNELGDFFMVRQTDAHAWVEVFLNGQWYAVDPSPIQQEGARSLLNLGKLFESVSFFWDRYILIFSAQDQLDTLSSAQDRYNEIRSSMKNADNLPAWIVAKWESLWEKKRLQLVASAILIGIVSFVLSWYLRKRKLRRVISSPVLFYQRMLAILLAKGFSRAPEMTPSEFMESLKKEIPQDMAAELWRLTQLFYRSRFGNYMLTEAERAAVQASLLRLEKL